MTAAECENLNDAMVQSYLVVSFCNVTYLHWKDLSFEHRMQRSFLNGSTRGGFRCGLAIVICFWEQHLNQRADASALLGSDVLHALLMQACLFRTWDSYINLACLSAHVAKRAPSETTSMILNDDLWLRAACS